MNSKRTDKEDAKSRSSRGSKAKSKGKSSKKSGRRGSTQGGAEGSEGEFDDHEHDFDELDVNPPKEPLCERIEPAKWHNIPLCLKEAFREDIENQEYLERYIMSVEKQLETQGAYIKKIIE